MQPKSKSDQFAPRWRHFHPQATVWVQNPFDQDVIYQVADEHNNPFQYRLPANKVSELPGGMVATLGVKEIVDRMIMNEKTDVLRIWEASVRQKHEEKIILRIKEAPAATAGRTPGGEIDLSVADEPKETNEDVDEQVELTTPDLPDVEPIGVPQFEPAFPGANQGGDPFLEQAAKAGTQDDVQLIEED